MIRAYKFRLRPTARQTQALTEMLRDHCSLYNGALLERRDAFRHPSRTTVRYGEQSAQLKEIRAFDPERQGRWSFSSQQAIAFLPNGAAAKAGLNRSILDAGWGIFLKIVANKAESAGRRVITVDARNTSRTCPACGHVARENRPTQARFECVACGFVANADHVGALNVLNRAGPALCVAA